MVPIQNSVIKRKKQNFFLKFFFDKKKNEKTIEERTSGLVVFFIIALVVGVDNIVAIAVEVDLGVLVIRFCRVVASVAVAVGVVLSFIIRVRVVVFLVGVGLVASPAAVTAPVTRIFAVFGGGARAAATAVFQLFGITVHVLFVGRRSVLFWRKRS